MPEFDSERHDKFLRLFTANESGIRAFVRALLPKREEAQEVMQEIAIVLWRKFGDFPTGDDFRKWAFGVARYEVLAHVRDKARDRHVFGDELLTLLADEASESDDRRSLQREALDHCLERLPGTQRATVLAAYAPGASIQQLAKNRGQTPMALYKLLHRIRLALADCTRRTLLHQP